MRGYFVPFLIAASGALDGTVLADEPLSLLRQIDAGFVQLFEQVAPSVVVIEAARHEEAGEQVVSSREPGLQDPDEAGENERAGPRTLSEGSGFFVRADGYILTNLHVVEGATQMRVRLKDGRRLPGKLIAMDEKTDIAVIKIDAADLPVSPLGDSDALKIGQLVGAIGAPFQQDYSFTCGWVSGKGRTNLFPSAPAKLLYEDYIQTDAFINPGNSGGPLFDVEGRVVGMNTLINGLGRGLAFAIPSNLLRDVAEQLIAHGKVQRPWLGLRLVAPPENGVGGTGNGVMISTIEANSPAYRSDLQPLDVITAIDGKEPLTPRDAQREILRRKVGVRVAFTVLRAGRAIDVPVITGELPDDSSGAPELADAELSVPKVEVLGLVLRDTGAGHPRILEIAPDSPAARAELAPGDTITAVEGEPQMSAGAATLALEAAAAKNAKKGVLVNIERAGKKSWIVIERARREPGQSARSQ